MEGWQRVRRRDRRLSLTRPWMISHGFSKAESHSSRGSSCRRRITKDELFRRILDAIDATDGRVAIASGTYDLVGVPTVRVQLKPEQSATGPAGH